MSAALNFLKEVECMYSPDKTMPAQLSQVWVRLALILVIDSHTPESVSCNSWANTNSDRWEDPNGDSKN